MRKADLNIAATEDGSSGLRAQVAGRVPRAVTMQRALEGLPRPQPSQGK